VPGTRHIGSDVLQVAAKFGGMDVSMMAEMKTMQEENRRLKKMFAELSMQNELLKEALGKNNPASQASRTGRGRCDAKGREHCSCLPYL
jgi:putative transposase